MVSKLEWRRGCLEAAPALTRTDVDVFFAVVDRNGDGRLSFDELWSALNGARYEEASEPQHSASALEHERHHTHATAAVGELPRTGGGYVWESEQLSLHDLVGGEGGKLRRR